MFHIFFSVSILFLYAALYRSVSIKIMIYLYLKKPNININTYFKSEFIKKSFDKRIKILINNGFLNKQKKYFVLSPKGKKYLSFFKKIQSIYKVKFSG